MATKLNIKQKIAQLERLENILQELARAFEQRAFKSHTPESNELIEEWASVKHLREKLSLLDFAIESSKRDLDDNISDDIKSRIRPRLERDLKQAENLIRSSSRVINSADKVFNRLDSEFKNKPAAKKTDEEEAKQPEKKVEKKLPPSKNEDVAKTALPIPAKDPILKKIDESIDKFNKKIPSIQKGMLEGIMDELKALDLKDGRIKTTVANLRLMTRIKNKLNKLILTDEYYAEVKDFAKSFNEITKLQNEYWKTVEKDFKPKTLLKEIRNQAISDTVDKLTEAGIGSNIGQRIADILRTNITSGGSYKSLTSQITESLTNTETDGLLTRYAKQITTDSINQYNAQYTQAVSNDLGFEWFAYQGSDIATTRPFCDAMTDIRYFHVSEVPRLLKAEDLYYTKDGKRTKVPIYDRTGLPHGMIEGTNAENFFVRRGGYNCGHQIRPVSEKLVPEDIKRRVKAS